MLYEMAHLLLHSAPLVVAPLASSAVFRVRYKLTLAKLTAGRICRSRTLRGCLVAPTDELNVLLTDLYDQFRSQSSCLMGIQILSVRRQAIRGRTAT